MFNKKTMVLYCGGSPGLAPAAPQSPGGGGGGGGSGGEGGLALHPGVVRGGLAGGGLGWPPAGCAEGPRALIGGGARAGPLSLIGPPEAAARALIGQAAAPPEEELDGCEPEPESPAEPSSPSSPSSSSPPASPADPLRQVTLQLVASYLREAADQEPPKQDGGGCGGGGKFLQGLLGRFGPCAGGEAETAARALETLRRVCDDIREKHQLAFQGMLRKVQIDKADDLKLMSEVATQVFNDGITNWGRIVTLISFGAFVAKHLKSINQESGINTLAEIITEVLVTEKREWLLLHDGWEGFVKFFHVEDLEGSIRNILVAFASVAGLGASLAYLIR